MNAMRTQHVATGAAVAATLYALYALRRAKRALERERTLRQEERRGRTRAEASLRNVRKRDTHGRGRLVEPIGTVSTPFVKRSGTPRQGAVCPAARGIVKFDANSHACVASAALDGLEEYSHCWLVFEFHANTDAAFRAAKVAPPRGYGAKVGWLATRAPHRAIPLGLSLVRIDGVDAAKLEVRVSALDLCDGTPVWDLKPYVPWDAPAAPIRYPEWVARDDALAGVKWSPAAAAALETLAPPRLAVHGYRGDDAVAAARDAKAEAERAASASTDATTAATTASAHARAAEDLAQLGSDFRDAADARDAKKKELDQVAEDAGVSGRRTQRECADEIRRLQEAKEAAVAKRARAEKDKSENLLKENGLIAAQGTARETAAKAAADLEKKKRLEADRADAEKTQRDVEARGKELRAGDAARRQALERAQAAAADCKNEWASKKKRARDAADSAKDQARSVKMAVDGAARGRARVDEAAATLKDLAKQNKDVQKKISAANKAACDAQRKENEASRSDEGREMQKRDVDANLAHRRKLKERDAKKEELTAAEAEAESNDDHPLSDKSPSDLQKRLKRIVSEKENLAGERGQHEGKRDRARTEARTHQGELQTARYRGVDDRHRTAMIERETTDMACKDVEHYWTALDRALGNFHALKIAEINRIVKELWQITYMGEDIDAIEIVSGEDAGSKRAARSYNYHVQMRKAGAALDMKGRCSAGQRVLASIVIRLALAQTFCIKCGILALDEPTTNLDEANRRSLAHGLSRIIADRAKQANFQLVVITHDEEFIGTLRTELAAQAGASMPEHYWRISREDLGGRHFSRIDKIPMDQLQ
mmetsp:Transcript_3087/g.9405  ORF Transcript_3087/g.9405 Transcript_3087/m.9405 type:complete len:830 (+) Transcript_3087:1230-3719(+)